MEREAGEGVAGWRAGCSREAGGRVAGGRVARHCHRAGAGGPWTRDRCYAIPPQTSALYKCSIIKVLHDTPASIQCDTPKS